VGILARLIAFPKYPGAPIPRVFDVSATSVGDSLVIPGLTLFINPRNLHIAIVPVYVYGLPLGIFIVPDHFFVILIAGSPVDVAPWVSMYLIARCVVLAVQMRNVVLAIVRGEEMKLANSGAIIRTVNSPICQVRLIQTIWILSFPSGSKNDPCLHRVVAIPSRFISI